MSISSIISKVFGIDEVKEQLAKEVEAATRLVAEAKEEAIRILQEKEEAEAALKQYLKDKEIASTSDKDTATERKEAWVSVVQTHFNHQDPRNGFFELDWNQYFIENLIQHGYGYADDPPEEIVDRWFRDLAGNILAEHDLPVNTTAGYVDMTKLHNGYTEVK